MNHYETLGITPDATEDEIKIAYRRAAREAHPDRDGGDAEKMQRINAAYAILGDAVARERYDTTGDEGHNSIEDDARSDLAKMISRHIDAESDDPIIDTKNELTRAFSGAQSEKEKTQKRLNNLPRLRARISSKSPDNIAHQVIDDRLARLKKHLEKIERCLLVAQKMQEILRDYSCDKIIEDAEEHHILQPQFYESIRNYAFKTETATGKDTDPPTQQLRRQHPSMKIPPGHCTSEEQAEIEADNKNTASAHFDLGGVPPWKKDQP
jgi:hypothetical protein